MSGPSAITASKSRRALLAGALGGLGAWAASAVGRAGPVRAANGDPLILGVSNTAANQTTLTRSGVDEAGSGLRVNASQNGWAITGVSAEGGRGVQGFSGTGRGVSGISNAGPGVFGGSNISGTGVHGTTAASAGADRAGVFGVAEASTGTAAIGVWGRSPNNVGVFGQSTSSHGLSGTSSTNTAVVGQSGTGHGVQGIASAAHGLHGQATSGVGVYGTATTGLALQTAGRAKFSTSGVATIAAGSKTKTVTPGVDVISSSFVLLTPKTNIGSRGLWFTTDATNNKFTNRMSSSRSSNTKIAWLLLG